MRFLRELEAAVPEYQVVMKVRAAALLRPVGGSEFERECLLRKVSQKEFDFVLVKQSFAACAIELDDRTHERSDRRRRDRQLEGFCESAGLPLVRFRVVRAYDRLSIREAVLLAIDKDRVARQMRRNDGTGVLRDAPDGEAAVPGYSRRSGPVILSKCEWDLRPSEAFAGGIELSRAASVLRKCR
ncbi:MAG: DUF2726 domain-containing protein [Planctomycetes bacterium]|nr:DUF2726 domain-containing protein [Planctomycetota bacterium]